jgi:hypothetical protein
MVDHTQDASADRYARAARDTTQMLDTFTALRPDWRQYEDAMVAYGEQLPPGALDMLTYLDVLYFLAWRQATLDHDPR